MLVDIKNKKFNINIELSDYCNAGCPLCARHKKGTSETKRFVNTSNMSLSQFKHRFDPTLIFNLNEFTICGNFGDPMMAHELPDILSYINEYKSPGLFVSIQTNGGLKGEKWWAKVGKEMSYFGNDSHIVFWLDGLEDTLHLYRRGVDYHKVIENAKTFMDNGGEAHWGFLEFAHNEHQVPEIYKRAKRLGFARVVTKAVSGFFGYNNDNKGAIEIDNERVKKVK